MLADGSTGEVERRTVSKDCPRDYPNRKEEGMKIEIDIKK
jgi:hypothetical protein